MTSTLTPFTVDQDLYVVRDSETMPLKEIIDSPTIDQNQDTGPSRDSESMTLKEIKDHLERIDEKLIIAKECGQDLSKENEQLNCRTKELQVQITVLERTISQAQEQTHQKTVDLFEKENRQKIVDGLKKENASQNKAVKNGEEKINQQTEQMEKIKREFEEKKFESEQTKAELMKKVEILETFLKSKDDLTKERDRQSERHLMYQEIFNDFKSKSKELKKQHKRDLSNHEGLSKSIKSPKTKHQRKLIKKKSAQIRKNAKETNERENWIKIKQDEINELKRQLNIQAQQMKGSEKRLRNTPPVIKFIPACVESSTPASNETPVTSTLTKKVSHQKPRMEPKKSQYDDAEREFFFKAFFAVNKAHSFNIDTKIGISAKTFWKKASEQKIHFPQFHNWVYDEMTKICLQNRSPAQIQKKNLCQRGKQENLPLSLTPKKIN